MFDSTVLTRLRPGENTTSLNFVRGKRKRERKRERERERERVEKIF